MKTSLNGLNGNRRFSRLPPFMMNSSQSKQRIKWYQNSPGNKFVRAGVLLFARVSSHSFSPLFFLPFHSYFFFFFFLFSNSITITMLVKSGHCDDVHPPGYFLTRRSFLFFFLFDIRTFVRYYTLAIIRAVYIIDDIRLRVK